MEADYDPEYLSRVPSWLLSGLARDPAYPKLAHPWTFDDLDGSTWTVASDGHLAVLAPGDYGAPRTVEGENTPPFASTFAAAGRGLEFDIDLDALREWAGAVGTVPDCVECEGRGRLDCETCDGDGMIECQCNYCDNVHDQVCLECGGEGRIWCASCHPDKQRVIDRVLLFGRCFDRGLLCRLVHALPASRAVLRMSATRLSLATEIIGDQFRAYVMPVRVNAERDDIDAMKRFGDAGREVTP